MIARISILLWVAIVCFLGAWYQEANTPPVQYVALGGVLMPTDVVAIRIISSEWRKRR